jgi:hypothetical protein
MKRLCAFFSRGAVRRPAALAKGGKAAAAGEGRH